MPQRPLAVRNVSPEELDELYRRTRMSRLCTRKRRKEIAELLEALLDEHSRETVYVAWDNAITHQNDEIEAIVRDAGTDAFHHWSQTPSWHVILFTLSNIKHRVTHVPPNVSNKTHNHVIVSGATRTDRREEVLVRYAHSATSVARFRLAMTILNDTIQV